jgi:hypothetical protein
MAAGSTFSLILSISARAVAFPVLIPAKRSSREEAGRPAPRAALLTLRVYVEESLLLIMRFRIAEPNAPPMARAENASPVAVDR